MKLQQVHLRINDAATGRPTPVRLRVTDPSGTPYAPFGRRVTFPTDVGVEVGNNVLLDDGPWCMIDGTCEIELPPGPLRIEARKGFEYRPLDAEVQLLAGKLSLRLSSERICDLRAEGWYSGDTCASFLTPHAALLEAAAEDLAVVDLLIREPGLANIAAFSGQAPIVSSPEHLVVVNTRNDGATGRLLLLNSHRIVYPLSFEAGGRWSLADWCDQCHRKGGLVVADDWLTRAPDSADLRDPDLLRRFDAIRHQPDASLDVWFDALDRGFRLPLVAGSGKESNREVLGSWRTYAGLGEAPLDYKNWIEAIRRGNTFVTRGPLLRLRIADGSAVAEVLGPADRVEIIANGVVIAVGQGRAETSRVEGWMVARCVDARGIAAVTSAIFN